MNRDFYALKILFFMEAISACNQINFKVQVRGKHAFALPCHLIISCFIPFNIMFHFLEK